MENLKILIPTDFSQQAAYAYSMVEKLKEKALVEIHFIHVLAVPDTVSMDANNNIQTCGEIDINFLKKQKEFSELKLAEIKKQYGEAVYTHLVLGKITDQILLFSISHHFDLIVMGTKGAWGIKEIVSGSETQIIARKSKLPLLSLMQPYSKLNTQNILLVHNFNHPQKENLQMLNKLMLAFNSNIHLLQITSGNVEAEKEMVFTNMETFAALNGIGKYQSHLVNGEDVEKGAIHFSQTTNMDMVCIGTHGKGGIFHHSATEKLINHLNKPIISFHLN